jgi:hypothetical protein
LPDVGWGACTTWETVFDVLPKKFPLELVKTAIIGSGLPAVVP